MMFTQQCLSIINSFYQKGHLSEETEDIYESYPGLFVNIISNLPLLERRKFFCLNKKWRLITSIVSRVIVYHHSAFNVEGWAQQLEKRVTFLEVQTTILMLPYNIENILNTPCQITRDDNLAVKDTHILVYIPKKIDTVKMTFEMLGKILRKNLQEPCAKASGYNYFKTGFPTDVTVDKDHWILLTQNILGGNDEKHPYYSRGMNYNDQISLIRNISNLTKISYSVPRALEVVAAMIAKFLQTSGNELLFNYNNPWTYTCCEEHFENTPVIVGNFSSLGIRVSVNYYLANAGIACMQRFDTIS